MRKGPLWALIAAYLLLALPAGSMRLDGDEFTFVREPYELLGGDYTVGYLRSGEYARAAATALKAYYLYWKYRPLLSPIISDQDKALFGREEKRFAYEKPPDPGQVAGPKNESTYRSRLIVPEPDRFYAHGAGKPLLSAVANILPLALVAVVTRGGPDLLSYQFRYNYHPLFILVRLSAILAGLAALVLVFLIARRAWGEPRAILAASLFLAYPPVLLYFPNIHHDAYMVPFLLGAAYAIARERYVLGGISYGLALAAKNAAIFFAPAIVAFVLWKLWRGKRSGESYAGERTLARSARGLLATGFVSVLALAPFANPVAYAQEILTPISGRAYDTRGENVEQLIPLRGQNVSTQVVQKLLPWNVFLGFVVLAALVCAPRIRDDVVALSFFFLLTVFPYTIVFGQPLNYRSLMFAPFFCLVAARLSSVRWCLLAVAVLAAADLVVLTDPFAARTMQGENAERLIGKGFELRVYDENVNLARPSRREPRLHPEPYSPHLAPDGRKR